MIHRHLAIEIIVDFCNQMYYSEQIAFLGICYYDRFMTVQGRHLFDDLKVQVLAGACLTLAIKMDTGKTVDYEELMDYYIDNNDIEIEKEEITEMEMEICVKLSFDLQIATQYDFLERYLRLLSDPNLKDILACKLCSLKDLSLEMLQTCLSDHRLLQYVPSQQAAAAIILAHNQLKMDELMKMMRKPVVNFEEKD